MKILRAIFVLLLCALLPISSLAASGLTGQCPMQNAVDDSAASPSAASGSDCDTMNSAAPAGHTKHPVCKVTSQCQMGSLYYPVAAPVAHRPASLASPIVFHYTQLPIVHTPDGLWRPPRAL